MTLLSAATPTYVICCEANVSHTLATEYGSNTLAIMGEQTNAGESLPEEREHTHKASKNSLTTPPTDLLESLRTRYQSGQLTEANSLAARLSQTFPLHPFAWKVLGAVAFDEGRIADAVSLHNKVIELAPSDAEAYFNLGIMLKAMGEPEGALANYRTAVSLKPEYPEALNNIGTILLDLNQLTDAEQSLKLAITMQPNNCRAHNNLGLVFAKRQQFDQAVHCYKTAISMDADFFDAVNNLGQTLSELGRLDEAIVVLARAVELQPANELAYFNLGSALAKVRFTSSQPALYETISDLLTKGNFVRPADVSEAVVSLLRHDPIVQDFLFNQQHLSEPAILLQKIENLSQIPLLHHFMRAHPLPDIEIESALTTLRSAVLRNIEELASETSIEKFLSSLALHCFVNEYIYAESEGEVFLISTLERKLQDSASLGQRPAVNELLCLATYVPLSSLKWLSKWDIERLPSEVRVRLLDEPAVEREIADSIPHLSTIAQETSLRVKQQYEENPYPRWTSAALSPRRSSVIEVFNTIGVNFADDSFQDSGPLQVLVAGCGTGQQPIEAAARYKDAQIIGIDLSTASLAYAQRKTEELGIKNVSYFCADILDIGQLGAPFDIIECSGVLHHMHDPMAGWRALTNQLRAGGLMRIALYSELAREHIVKVKEEIETQKIKSSPSDIRNFRQALISSTAPHHVKLQNFLDFYSLSELRDLIFHTQEHRFTALKIQESLNELGLCFLGFEGKSIRSKLRNYEGDNSDHRDLAAWHDLETNAPDTFSGMYQFWCQKG